MPIHTPLSIVQDYGSNNKFDEFIIVWKDLPKEVKVIRIMGMKSHDNKIKKSQTKKHKKVH